MKKWLAFILSLLTFGFLPINTANAETMNSNSQTNSNAPTTSSNEDAKCMMLKLKYGEVYIELFDQLAPNHVARIIELTESGFYNGLKFHRVIPGFMAQTGDPKGDGTGGSGKNLKAEFSKHRHIRGTVSMARAASPDSGDSQFFIVYAPSKFLDGQYTVFGEVVKGMEFVDKIKKGSSLNNGAVENPDKILEATILPLSDCK